MNIIVTGASKGIGFELAKYFAKEKNNTVFAVSRTTDNLRKLEAWSEHKNVVPVATDIAYHAGRHQLIHQIEQHTKSIDIVIHNAGSLINKPFAEISEDELEYVYKVNVFAPYLLTQSLLPYLGKAERSHVLMISSMGGVQGSSKFAGLSAYSPSKAAVAGIAECLAEELKEKNISVNCLALGAVQTEMLEQAFPGYKAPLQPEEMAGFIGDFALSGHKFFNGKILPVSSSTP
jgi:3-oxoacyl-[acyl-carrier protein] reductase